MPKKSIIALFLLSFCNSIVAQRNQINLSVAVGPNYFANKQSVNNPVGYSKMAGINFFFFRKKSAFSFKPGLNLIANDYDARLQLPNTILRVKQRLIGLNLETLLRLNKSSYLKVGLFINKVMSSRIDIIYSQSSGNYFAYGNSYLDNTYTDKYLQAGVSLGVSFPFMIKTVESKFNITCVQNAMPFLEYDFELPNYPAKNGKALFSSKALPTFLMFGFEVALKKHLKKEVKKSEEEEE
jgi:hypothetical protein